MKIYASDQKNILDRLCGTDHWIKVAYNNHIYLFNILERFKNMDGRMMLRCKMVMWNQLVMPKDYRRSIDLIYKIDKYYYVYEDLVTVKEPIDVITDDELIDMIQGT